MQQIQRIWTKDFILVSAINFCLNLVSYLLIVLMSSYSVHTFHASISQAGLVSSILIVGILIGRLSIGKNIEKIGYRNVLFAGVFLCFLSTSLYLLRVSIVFLILVRLLHGGMLGIALTAANTIVASIVPLERRGTGIGYFSLSTIIGTAIGSFLGIFMIQYTSYPIIFVGCMSIGMISFLLTFFISIPPSANTMKGVQPTQAFRLKNFIEPKALPISMVMLIIGFSYSAVLTYIHFYAIELGLVQAASFFFLTYSIAVLVSRPLTGHLLDRKGAHFVMYPTFILFMIGMLLLSMAESSFMLLAASVLIGLGFGNMQTCAQTIAIQSVPREKIGLATSTFAIFLEAGLGFGPYLLGFFLTYLSYSQLYALLTIVILLGSVLYFILFTSNRAKSV